MLDAFAQFRPGPRSTAQDVLAGRDLSGQRVLITGVSAGIGVETARALAAHGAEVVGAVRDFVKAAPPAEHIRAEAEGGGSLELVKLDLASLASVRACADALLADGRSFDLVVCNAGVMATALTRTEDGFEADFGVNFLGHFVLANRIAPLMRPGARLVALTSAGHRRADVDLIDPNFERTPFDPFVAYARSNTASILFAVAFDRRHRADGVRAAAVHPGFIQTELTRHFGRTMIQQMIGRINSERAPAGLPHLTWKSILQGAATTVWAGVVADAEEIGGRYCQDCAAVRTVSGDPAAYSGVQPYAVDPAHAEALWDLAERLAGERFDAPRGSPQPMGRADAAA